MASRGVVRLVWKGAEVARKVQENLEAAYTEFGLRVEGESKKELRKGHGVLTATLRRSIHLAEPGYNWSADDVKPSAGSQERGGQAVRARTVGSRTTLTVGSGLKYALAVHQGHDVKSHGVVVGKLAGYHYLSNGLAKVKPKLKSILEKHRMKK